MPVISVENVSKRYRKGSVGYHTLREDLYDLTGRLVHLRKKSREDTDEKHFWALSDVSFQIEQGERVGIIGRNGCGKTTLLRLLAGITRPNKGKIRVKGRMGVLIELMAGFHPELSGRENIYLNGAIIGMSRKEVKRKFNEIVAFAELEDFIDTPIKHYSSGMNVRLGFALAAHLDPDILLVDEVLAVGDVEFQKKCLGKMGSAAQEGRTVVFVSHNMVTIQRLCPRCILLHAGQVIADGETEKVVPQYSTSLQIAGERVFEPDTEKAAQILRVSVRNSGRDPSPKLDMAYPVVVMIEYQIRQEVRKVGVACNIMSVDGIILLSIEDHDLDANLFWGERSPGRYVTSFEIPGGLLNAGKYVLRVTFGGDKFSYDDHEVFQFEIEDIQGLIKWHRAGVLSPTIPWTTKRLD
jgi:lipopolysaccharide transport system ATP-binding protein